MMIVMMLIVITKIRVLIILLLEFGASRLGLASLGSFLLELDGTLVVR